MNKITLSIIVGTFTLFTFMPVYARYYGEHHYNGYHHSRYHYDESSVATLKGDVELVEYVKYGRHHSAGVHVVLKTQDGTIRAYLGPESYLEDRMKLSKGDTLEVFGSLIDDNGVKAIVAREVKKGSEVVVLREKDGTPMWSGSGMGRHRR